MKKTFTFSGLRYILMTAVLMLVSSADMMAGDAWYAYYNKLVAYPTGAGTVYADEYGYDAVDETLYANESELQCKQSYSPGGYYAYAKPADGWILAGFSAATFDEAGQPIFNDAVIETSNPAYLTIYSEISTEEGADSSSIDYPLDPNNVHYALFTHVAPRYAAGQDSLGTLSISKVCNEIGDNVTLTATPRDERCHFDRWTLDGETVSTEASFSVDVTKAAEYVAHFTCDSAVIINFPEDGGYIYWYDDVNDISVPDNVTTLDVWSDYVYLNNGETVDSLNFSEGSYYASACNATILYGKGEATLVKTPSSYPYASEYSLLRWSGDNGVAVADLDATSTSYYTFDTSNATFNLAKSGETIAAQTTYLAVPDSLYKNGGDAPSIIYTSYADKAAGINSVKTDSKVATGIYTLGGIRQKEMNRNGIYIFDGKKVLYRRK